MKVHLPPPLPPSPPAIPQKPPPTSFELEQAAEELIATARQLRLRNDRLNRARPRQQDKDAGSDSSEPDRRLNRDAVDFLA